jgi:inner membrane protein YidH
VNTDEPSAQAEDSRVRTYLAGERTFLAWLRTGIVLIASGIAAAALTETDGSERAVATGLGGLAVVAGCLLVLWAHIDYRSNIHAIANGAFEPSSKLPLTATLLTGVVGIAAIAFVIVEWAAD